MIVETLDACMVLHAWMVSTLLRVSVHEASPATDARLMWMNAGPTHVYMAHASTKLAATDASASQIGMDQIAILIKTSVAPILVKMARIASMDSTNIRVNVCRAMRAKIVRLVSDCS